MSMLVKLMFIFWSQLFDHNLRCLTIIWPQCEVPHNYMTTMWVTSQFFLILCEVPHNNFTTMWVTAHIFDHNVSYLTIIWPLYEVPRQGWPHWPQLWTRWTLSGKFGLAPLLQIWNITQILGKYQENIKKISEKYLENLKYHGNSVKYYFCKIRLVLFNLNSLLATVDSTILNLNIVIENKLETFKDALFGNRKTSTHETERLSH